MASSERQSASPPLPSQASALSEERQCWICFATEAESGPVLAWVHPCRCRGDTKWVHEVCLLAWIDEKLTQNSGNGNGVGVVNGANGANGAGAAAAAAAAAVA